MDVAFRQICSAFLLTSYSPLGKLSPGASHINDVFQDMWREVEKNRMKWGCEFGEVLLLISGFIIYPDLSCGPSDLGRTHILVDYSDSERTPTIWLSYWNNLKGLQEFSTSSAHRLGQNNYDAKKYP